MSVSFWGFFLYFLVAIVMVWTMPGVLLLQQIQLTRFQKIVLGTVVGMVLWGVLGFVLGFLQMRNVMYGYVGIVVVVVGIRWIFQNRNRFRIKVRNDVSRFDWIVICLVLLGILVQLSTVWFTGILTSQGMYSCCGAITDSLWHIALTNALVQHVPPIEPGMSGVVVHNYHYFGNLVTADLIRVFRLPLIATSYQYMTVFLSLWLGLSAIVFGQLVTNKQGYIRWLVFFLYAGGDLVYLFLLHAHVPAFSMNSLEDGAIFLVNPPRAFATVTLLSGLSLLYLYSIKQHTRTALITGLVLGSIISMKVYTGIFALAGLAAIAVFFALHKKFSYFFLFLIASLLSLTLYLPVNSAAGGVYFTGLWLFENFISQPQLHLISFELARQQYTLHHNLPRIISLEIFYIILYSLAIFGTKLLACFQTKKSLALIPLPLHLFLITGLAISAIAGTLFQQTSGGSNSFNFLVSLFVFLSIYSALAVWYWTTKFPRLIGVLVGILIIIFTIPRVSSEFVQNIKQLSGHEGYLISTEELAATRFIRTSTPPDALVATIGLPGKDFDTPYISFLTERPMYLSGKGILDSHAVDTSGRYYIVGQIFRNSNVSIVAHDLQKTHIQYIMMEADHDLSATPSAAFLHPVFTNSEFKILKVDSEELERFLE